MRVIVCPDSFTGTLSASEAATAIAEGWLATSPQDEVVLLPLSDGGPGFASSMAQALGGEIFVSEVRGPDGNTVAAQWTRVGTTAYIESAAACGLHLVGHSAVWNRSTFGVGQLMMHAIASGCSEIVVGLGGSGTNDAGVGALIALGAKVFDKDGVEISDEISRGPEQFVKVSRIDLSDAMQQVTDVSLEIATDVENPLLGLRGASHEYAPQKGASTQDVIRLESLLTHISEVIGRRADGKNPAVALGAGAAGGLGYGLMCINAVRSSGIRRIMSAVNFRQAINGAKVIVTGEGHFDWQSLRGKVVNGVADAAMELAIPVVVIAGQVSIGRRDWSAIGVSAAYAVSEDVSLEHSLSEAFNSVRDTAARVAKTWART